MRGVFFFIFIFFLLFESASAFTTVPLAQLVFDPDFESVFETNDSDVMRISFFILNNGTRSADIINASIIGTNFKTIKTTSNIKSGFTSEFIYEVQTDVCDFSLSDIHFELYYYKSTFDVNSLSSTSFSLSSSEAMSFPIINPLDEDLVFELRDGGGVDFSVFNGAEFPVNIEVDLFFKDFFATIQTQGVTLDLGFLENKTFLIAPKSFLSFNIDLLPTKPVRNAALNVSITDVECGQVISFTKSIDFIDIIDNFVRVEVVDGLDFLGVLLIFFVGFLFYTKHF